MTRFIDINYPTRHHGADRVASVIDAAEQVRRDFSGARGLATLLLSALTAAVMVVAYQVMDSVAEGHLLAIWIALWLVAFAALVIFAGMTRQFAARAKSGLDTWSRPFWWTRLPSELIVSRLTKPIARTACHAASPGG